MFETDPFQGTSNSHRIKRNLAIIGTSALISLGIRANKLRKTANKDVQIIGGATLPRPASNGVLKPTPDAETAMGFVDFLATEDKAPIEIPELLYDDRICKPDDQLVS